MMAKPYPNRRDQERSTCGGVNAYGKRDPRGVLQQLAEKNKTKWDSRRAVGLLEAHDIDRIRALPQVRVSWYRVQVESVSPVLCKSSDGTKHAFRIPPEQRKASGVQGPAMRPLVAVMDAAKS